MPFGGGIPKSINSSGIVFNSDLVVPAGYKITVDRIESTTAANMVDMDELLLALAMED